MAFEVSSSSRSWHISPAHAASMASGSQSLSLFPQGWCLWARVHGTGWCKRRGPASRRAACWYPSSADASRRRTWAPFPPLHPNHNGLLWGCGLGGACWMSLWPFWIWFKRQREGCLKACSIKEQLQMYILYIIILDFAYFQITVLPYCLFARLLLYTLGIQVNTHLLLLFFLLGAFLIGTTGQPAALLFLGLGVLVILGVLGCLIGGSSSSILLCFSFSTFFFFFLSFFSFFFLGLTMGPWDSAVSCSCTAFNWWGKKRQMTQTLLGTTAIVTLIQQNFRYKPAPAALPADLPSLPQSQSSDCSRFPHFHYWVRSLTMMMKRRRKRKSWGVEEAHLASSRSKTQRHPEKEMGIRGYSLITKF